MPTTVYFATNRRLIEGQGGPEFSDGFHEQLDELRFGKVAFSGTRLFAKDLGAVAAGGRIEVADERLHPTDVALAKLGSKAVFAEVSQRMREGRDALVFIHGYNHTFRESAGRAAQLQQWLAKGERDLVMLMFAWPSAGAGVAPRTYSDDRQRAKASGLALARALLKATDFIRAMPRDERCLGRVHLLAHSMGNWALTGAVQMMRTFVGDNIPPLFDEVVLSAGDEDDDALAEPKKMAPILRGCRRVTVYYNQQDLALKASDVAMGNPDRLGRSGPKIPTAAAGKIVPVNVSPAIVWQARGAAAWTRDETGHQYYRNNATVLADIAQVLDGTLDDEITGRTRRETHFQLG